MSYLTYREKEEIAYPSSDGKPFAENDLIFDYMAYSLETLKFYFKNRLDVYVSANSFVYYEEGNKKAVVAPDVYVVFGVQKRLRDKYKVWQEGGIIPQFILEVTSEETKKQDQDIKPKIYQKLGVREYFYYEPLGAYLNPLLQGMRLVNDRYQPIEVNHISFDTLWVYSEVLGLELHVISGEFMFRDPETGKFFDTRQKQRQTMREAQSAFKQSEAARRLKEEERRVAELSFQESKQARLAAESALRSLISHLLNSGMNLAQVAQMMNLSTSEVQRLVGRNE
jgi:Uma2 family endonuclease